MIGGTKGKLSMRRDRRPKQAKNVVLGKEQYALLELISSQSLGEPSVSSLIRTAVDEFIASQARARPELGVEIERVRSLADQAKNVVPLRSLPDEKGGG
jgi:hypothetical protein